MYDKKGKNTLDGIDCLTRFETRVKLKSSQRILIDSYEDLRGTVNKEMKVLMIDNYKDDKKARVLSQNHNRYVSISKKYGYNSTMSGLNLYNISYLTLSSKYRSSWYNHLPLHYKSPWNIDVA